MRCTRIRFCFIRLCLCFFCFFFSTDFSIFLCFSFSDFFCFFCVSCFFNFALAISEWTLLFDLWMTGFAPQMLSFQTHRSWYFQLICSIYLGRFETTLIVRIWFLFSLQTEHMLIWSGKHCSQCPLCNYQTVWCYTKELLPVGLWG